MKRDQVVTQFDKYRNSNTRKKKTISVLKLVSLSWILYVMIFIFHNSIVMLQFLIKSTSQNSERTQIAMVNRHTAGSASKTNTSMLLVNTSVYPQHRRVSCVVRDARQHADDVSHDPRCRTPRGVCLRAACMRMRSILIANVHNRAWVRMRARRLVYTTIIARPSSRAVPSIIHPTPANFGRIFSRRDHARSRVPTRSACENARRTPQLQVW